MPETQHNPKPWNIRANDEERVAVIARTAGLPRPLAALLALREIDADNVESFLKPRLSDLSDPFLLPMVEPAVERLWQAIEGGETITVFGDYDVDGVTSTALAVRVLRGLGGRVTAFIPDRLDEGYGLSQEAVERCLSESKPSLILSVDCGINSLESVAYAAAQGVDVIVTDHHEPDEQTAPALAVINPKLGTVPMLKQLSGVGVAFKLLHAVIKRGKDTGRTAADAVDLRDYLDLVALGTVADLVPLTAENRILVRHGLERMNHTNWVGLKALMNAAGIRGAVDTYHVGFQLGPRINAAGRIGQPMMALQLLITEDEGEARRIAKRLNDTNTERQRMERSMARTAFEEIDAYFDPTLHFGLTVANEAWHPGVVGIVASRISRRYNRPAIVMGIEPDGTMRGSCRSIEVFDMLKGLTACEKHLARYGGHCMAAGLELHAGELEVFRETFNASAQAVLGSLDLMPVQTVDAVLQPDEVTEKFYDCMQQLAPFGQENPQPVWALFNTKLAGEPRVVGKKHLRFSVKAGGKRFEAIAFDFSKEQLPDGPMDIAFVLKENHWNGRTTLQLQVQAVRPAERAAGEAE